MAIAIAMLSFRIPPATLEIVDGDISLQDVDAIVNAANNHFWMGSGVAGALKARGGPAIETEAMALGPVEPGDAVVTGGRAAACAACDPCRGDGTGPANVYGHHRARHCVGFWSSRSTDDSGRSLYRRSAPVSAAFPSAPAR